jgi:hypothetical protein
LDDRLHNEKALKDLLPVSVIAEIPPITGVEEEKKQARKVRLSWAATGLVFGTILVGSAISFFRG